MDSKPKKKAKHVVDPKEVDALTAALSAENAKDKPRPAGAGERDGVIEPMPQY
jgi:hypothetical protein